MANEHLWRKNEWSNGGSYYYDNGQQLKFDPPCYIQRYATVAGVIRDHLTGQSGKKVVEFGCAELSFVRELKAIPAVEEMLEVDIDETLLKNSYQRAQPEPYDIHRDRETPLTVQILAGSVDEFDSCLENANIVVAIELIEHLHLNVLERVPENIFGSIQPELAIITTPNADFNVAIPNLSGFRHDDHKFEWTRAEFENWSLGITEKYPYSVLFYGIGRGPEGTEHFGCCSQMAVFRLNLNAAPKTSTEKISNYKLIKEYVYPFHKTTTEDKIMQVVNFQLYHLAEQSEKEPLEIPLKLFLQYLKDVCEDVQILRKVLESFDYEIIGSEEEPIMVVDFGHSSDLDDEEPPENIVQPIPYDYVDETWD